MFTVLCKRVTGHVKEGTDFSQTSTTYAKVTWEVCGGFSSRQMAETAAAGISGSNTILAVYIFDDGEGLVQTARRALKILYGEAS